MQGQLLVLLQAGIDQAVVELTDQIDTAFTISFHRVGANERNEWRDFHILRRSKSAV